MSNRKPAPASKRSRSPKSAARSQRTKTAARSHRTKQSLVRSPKDKPLRAAALGPTESPPMQHDDLEQEAFLAEKKRAAFLAENRAEDINRMLTGQDSGKRFDLSLATTNMQPLVAANMQGFQAKLPQLAQANMRFAQANMQFLFEFGRRLSAMRSPLEIFSVIVEFTGKRMEMFRTYSQEITELAVKGIA